MADAGVARILFVEDDEAFATAVARLLRAHGHEVRIEPSAEEARAALAGGYRPGLVILDINLPGETGWSLMRGPELGAAGRPPVVVVTATHVCTARLREFGVAGYLPKPLAMETLVSIIRRVTREGQAAGSEAGDMDAV